MPLEGSSPAEVRCTPYVSDNGTNFVGAEKELRRTLCEWNTNFLAEQLRQRGV